jgi:hypothetical protein
MIETNHFGRNESIDPMHKSNMPDSS